jgi:hypothetical protein
VKLLSGGNPVACIVRVKASPGTSYHAEILRDQFVWVRVILHVGFTVGVMLGKMTTAYYATMVAANEAAHKINALIAINNAAARSGWLTIS